MYIVFTQDTGIGKIIRKLQKQDGEVGDIADELMTRWKRLLQKPAAEETTHDEASDTGEILCQE